jgi:AcrR family transcriptional regulator
VARPLRADARENLDRILHVSAAAFAEPGSDTSMKAIAHSAGVGVATLYRRFPTREDLIEATYRTQTARLCERVDALLVSHPPRQALATWLEAFVDYMLVKDGMAEALPAILNARDGLRAASRSNLSAAVETLLRAGRDSGHFRDVPAWDVLMAIGGITLIAAHEHQRELASRLIAILITGISTPRTEAS